MDSMPREFIKDSRLIGDHIGNVVTRDAERFGDRGSGFDASEIIDTIAHQIDRRDARFESSRPEREAAETLASLLAPYVASFMELLRREDFQKLGALPQLQLTPSSMVPIDATNSRATDSIVATLRQEGPYLPRSSEFGAKDSAETWQRLGQLASLVELDSLSVVSRNFFRLFTSSFWSARRTLGRGSAAAIHFTVDCMNHGYQLEYWPQFFFSPTVFGGSLTRPVKATIPVNHYHFQGWKNGNVTRDGGLYLADANNTTAFLRAF